MTSFSRKRFDRAKRARAKGGRTPDILRKSGPHKPQSRDLLRNKSTMDQSWEVEDYEDSGSGRELHVRGNELQGTDE